MMKDRKLAGLSKAISAGKATYKTVEDAAVRIGTHSARSLGKVITTESVPEMSWLIAERTLKRQAELQYDLISGSALSVQQSLYKRANIGLKALTADFDVENIEQLMGRLCEGKLDDALWVLGDPVVHAAMNVVDETIRVNAGRQSAVGMRPTVTRTPEANACEWCQSLAGTYEYADVRDRGNDVWKRHNNCRCDITYDPGDFYGK